MLVIHYGTVCAMKQNIDEDVYWVALTINETMQKKLLTVSTF